MDFIILCRIIQEKSTHLHRAAIQRIRYIFLIHVAYTTVVICNLFIYPLVNHVLLSRDIRILHIFVKISAL
jgi:hypothetical protein